MSGRKPQPHAIVPAHGGKELADAAAEKVVGRLLQDATPAQKKAITTLVAPWAEKLVRGLDDLIRIPGTNFGIGLDGIVGFFFPGVGDVVTGIGSMAMLGLALKHKIPTVAIARMLINIAIDTIVGSVPIVGDIFDVFWKSNRKNLAIIQKFKDNPKEKPHAGDYVLVALSALFVVVSFVAPIVIAFMFGASLLTLLTLLFRGGTAQ